MSWSFTAIVYRASILQEKKLLSTVVGGGGGGVVGVQSDV